MVQRKRITVVGGGLAGLTLGIGLRLRGVPVTIWEAGSYPRHRVCGEFVSGGGQGVLERLGLQDILLRAGAIMARTVAFFIGEARSPNRVLTPPAWCLSRFVMDEEFSKRFCDCGGELRLNSRWRGEHSAKGLVFATGRRVQAVDGRWRWLGLKAHARQVPLEADLEMHGLSNGYIGLCRLPDGKINVCGLFRQDAHARFPVGSWEQLLRGPAGTSLSRRLDGAVFDQDSFCSIAGLGLSPHRAVEQTELSIGDALTMIPPVTGNGMSMAFEGAESAISPLAAYSEGDISWQEARFRAARACDCAFARRLAWARLLQWLMFAPAFKTKVGTLGLSSQLLWRLMFAMTR